MKHNRRRHIIWVLACLLVATFTWRLFQWHSEWAERTIRLSVFLPRDSQLFRLTNGIRDCARDNGVLLDVVYTDDWQQQTLLDTIQEEKMLGTEGIFVVYPSRFFKQNRSEVISEEGISVLALDEEPQGIFPYYALYQSKEGWEKADKTTSAYAEELQKLASGEINILMMPNEYQMGYRCIQTLYDHARGEEMTDVFADILLLTQETLDSGMYDTLLNGEGT